MVNEVYQFPRQLPTCAASVLALASLLLSSCSTVAPPCARASDCRDGSLCHLGRCSTRLETPASARRLVLTPAEELFASDDPEADGRLDPNRHAALYLSFAGIPSGNIDAAYLALPLRVEEGADVPTGPIALSIGAIIEPWNTSDARRGGPPQAGASLSRLRVRASATDGVLRLDVADLLRSAPEARTFGIVIRAEHAGDDFDLATRARGGSPPTLSVYLP